MSGGNLQSIAESSPVPRRKRKRTSDVTAEIISVAQPIKSMDEFERALHSPATKKQPPRKAKRSSYSSQDQDTAEEDDEYSDADAPEDDLKDTVEGFDDSQLSANDHDKEALGHIINGTTNGAAANIDEDDSMHDIEVSGSEEQNHTDQQPGQTPGPDDIVEQPGNARPKNSAPQEPINSQEEELETRLNGDDAERGYDEDAELDNSRDELTMPKQIGIATLDPTPVVSAAASPTGSNQESNADQESPTKQSASVLLGGALTASQDGDKPVKRLPGRRRAPHANPKVEAALRRQLHLRMAYRAVAKNLKPILAELAKRSLSSIHKSSEAHTTFSEYSVVKNGLNEKFEGRLAWIQKQKDLNKQRLDDILAEQTAMRRRNFEVSTIALRLFVNIKLIDRSMLPKTSKMIWLCACSTTFSTLCANSSRLKMMNTAMMRFVQWILDNFGLC